MQLLLFSVVTFGQGNSSIFSNASEKLREVRSQIKEWDQSVLGFRKEHQFSWTLGLSQGRWRFKRFGNQVNKYHSDLGSFTKFRYAYHLPIWRSFGYLLGTSAGYWDQISGSSGMEIQSISMLPGIVSGFVLNMSPGFRTVLALDYYLERWSGLQESNNDGEEPNISVTARSVDVYLALDIFYQLKWAIRIEAHKRWSDYKQPRQSDGKEVHASISREDYWYGLGLLYHLM